MLAQAISRTTPTMASRTNNGRENWRRRSDTAVAGVSTSRAGGGPGSPAVFGSAAALVLSWLCNAASIAAAA